jgi:hypothetical protein
MHIVNVKAIYNGNTTLAVADNESIAALGFFLEVSRHKHWSHWSSETADVRSAESLNSFR